MWKDGVLRPTFGISWTIFEILGEFLGEIWVATMGAFLWYRSEILNLAYFWLNLTILRISVLYLKKQEKIWKNVFFSGRSRILRLGKRYFFWKPSHFFRSMANLILSQKSSATQVIGLKLFLPFNWDFSFRRKKLGGIAMSFHNECWSWVSVSIINV